jgi:hypothetical protein
LSRLEQADHDRLVDEQIRWSKGRDAMCANEPLRQRETCIDQMTEKRTQALQKRLAALPPPRATADKPFEGHWEYCQKWKGTNVCDSYTLFQKERRICGLWSYVATNSLYDGRLVWIVADNAAATNYICGRPGSKTSYWCPGTMLGSIPESATGWQKIRTPEWSYVCTDKNGRYLSTLEGSCASKRTAYTKTWRPLNAQQKAMLRTETWLEQCLNDPGYPPRETVVSGDVR